MAPEINDGFSAAMRVEELEKRVRELMRQLPSRTGGTIMVEWAYCDKPGTAETWDDNAAALAKEYVERPAQFRCAPTWRHASPYLSSGDIQAWAVLGRIFLKVEKN